LSLPILDTDDTVVDNRDHTPEPRIVWSLGEWSATRKLSCDIPKTSLSGSRGVVNFDTAESTSSGDRGGKVFGTWQILSV